MSLLEQQQITHFVVPPYGIEFESIDLADNWIRQGLKAVQSLESINTPNTFFYFPARQVGGVVSVVDEEATTKRLLNIGRHLHARAYSYGTSVGNLDGLSMRNRVQKILAEPSPLKSKLFRVKPKLETRVKCTFEHVKCGSRRFLVFECLNQSREFALLKSTCMEIGIVLEQKADFDESLNNEIAQLASAEAQPNLKIAAVIAECDVLHLFAKLMYAALFYEMCGGRSKALHLLADFSPMSPSFRKHWTSNR